MDSAPALPPCYRRADGRVGTRNEIWILCTVGCVGRTAERIARLAADRCKDRVDGVYFMRLISTSLPAVPRATSSMRSARLPSGRMG
jgi:hypothetical protein